MFKETVKILTNKRIKHRLQWPQMAENTKFMAYFGKKNTKKSPENVLSFCLMLIPRLITSLFSEELSQHRASMKKIGEMVVFSLMFSVFLVWLWFQLLENLNISMKILAYSARKNFCKNILKSFQKTLLKHSSINQ